MSIFKTETTFAQWVELRIELMLIQPRQTLNERKPLWFYQKQLLSHSLFWLQPQTAAQISEKESFACPGLLRFYWFGVTLLLSGLCCRTSSVRAEKKTRCVAEGCIWNMLCYTCWNLECRLQARSKRKDGNMTSTNCPPYCRPALHYHPDCLISPAWPSFCLCPLNIHKSSNSFLKYVTKYH